MNNCIEESKGILEALRLPFKAEDIEWRVQSASQNQKGTDLLILPYITSRAVMDRLDNVLGGFWQSNVDKIEGVNPVAYQCRLSLKIGDEWITRTDAAEASDIESVKGGHSNSLKRAAVQWGIARYLYDLKPFWVPLKERGEHRVYGNFKIKGQTQLLKGYFDTPVLPNWALPTQQNNNATSKNQTASVPIVNQQHQNTKTDTREKQTKLNDHQRSIAAVNHLLVELNVSKEHVMPLFKKASGSNVNQLEQATTQDLGKLYHVLLPVSIYVRACSEFKLDEDRILYYAQITLKQELNSIQNLFFKMTKEICGKTIEIVRADLNQNKVV